ncbi:MAG: BON domain-containing protein [Pirellulaceae bacterium]
MSRATRLPKPLMFSMAALCGLLTVSSSAMGQGATDGGFGNFGLGTASGFGSIGGNSGSTGASGGQGATAGLSSLGGLSGAGGTGSQAGGLGGLGGIGSGFDPSFGASQMASGLATAAAVSRVTSQLGGRGGFGGGFGGGGFGGGRGGFGGTNNNQNAQSKTKVRAVLRIGFPVEGRTSSATAQMVTERFAKMPLPPSLDNVQITMQGRTAVLRGQIETLEDGKLVENLLSLEPGIDGVKNELVVAGESEEVPAPIPTE